MSVERPIQEEALDDLVEGRLFVPEGGEIRSAVRVLSGSSGRAETARARVFAKAGHAAIAMRWFGGPGQPQGICELPLETFTPAIDRLAACSPRVGVVGVSKGAEAALLLGVRDPRIAVVGALAHVDGLGQRRASPPTASCAPAGRPGAGAVNRCPSRPMTTLGCPGRSPSRFVPATSRASAPSGMRRGRPSYPSSSSRGRCW